MLFEWVVEDISDGFFLFGFFFALLLFLSFLIFFASSFLIICFLLSLIFVFLSLSLWYLAFGMDGYREKKDNWAFFGFFLFFFFFLSCILEFW